MLPTYQFGRIAPKSVLVVGQTWVCSCHSPHISCQLSLTQLLPSSVVVSTLYIRLPPMGEDFHLKVIETCLHQSGNCHAARTSKAESLNLSMKTLAGSSVNYLVCSKVGKTTSMSSSKNHARKRLSRPLDKFILNFILCMDRIMTIF